VDTTAAVSAAVFRQVLDVVVADPGVDAVLAIGVPTAVGGPLSDLGSFLDRRSDNPVVLVRPDQAEAVRADREGSSAWTPSFAEPAVAGRALAAALRRSRWLDRPRTALATPPRVDAARARRVVTTAFSADPAGGRLDPVAAVELLAAAGVPVVTTTVVGSAGAAMAARRTLGRPVALKANVAGLVHRTSAGAVRTGLDSADSIVEAVDAFRQAFGPRLRGIVVQPMADPGLELLVGVTTDPLCGPLLTHGLGGVATDLVEDRSHCLVPATDADLADLLDGLRASEVLRLRDDAAALRAAVGDVAARLARLAELLAELAEVEVNPLVWANGAAVAVDVRARLAPADPSDPFIRALPS